jgi:hypothetical protein
MKLKLD